MGLAHRIIPTLLCKGRTLVKGEGFKPWRTVGMTVQGVRINQARNVDELVLLDVTATAEGRGPDLELVRELSEILYAPLAVGGGVRTVEDVRQLLRAGADKVVIGTAAQRLGRTEANRLKWTVTAVADAVGCQAVVVAIDVKDGKVWTNGGEVLADAAGAAGNAELMQELGAGEILLTSIDREGSMRGYDLELIKSVSAAVSIPVIAHGGCRDYADMAAAIRAGASAVAAGALFQFTEATPREAAMVLHSQYGIEVRL